jgi:hypothetical protein
VCICAQPVPNDRLPNPGGNPARARQLQLPESLHLYVSPPPPVRIETGDASRCDGCDQARCAELNLPESLGLYTARASVAEQRHLGWAAVTSTTASGAAVVASGAASAAGRSDGFGALLHLYVVPPTQLHVPESHALYHQCH